MTDADSEAERAAWDAEREARGRGDLDWREIHQHAFEAGLEHARKQRLVPASEAKAEILRDTLSELVDSAQAQLYQCGATRGDIETRAKRVRETFDEQIDHSTRRTRSCAY